MRTLLISMFVLALSLGGCASIDNPDCHPYGVDASGECQFPEGNDGGAGNDGSDGASADSGVGGGPSQGDD